MVMRCSKVGYVMVAACMMAMNAWAGTWSKQATLANNAYQGSIALDASGNMVAVWYQNAVNGVLTEEIWASNAPFGGTWSAPVDLSGGLASASGPGYPLVHTSAAGFST